MVIEIIGLANVLYEQENTLTVRWVPGHQGNAENEAADAYAKNAAKRRAPDKGSRLAAERIGASFLKRRAAERATCRWKEDIASRNQGKRTFRLPKSKPELQPSLRT